MRVSVIGGRRGKNKNIHLDLANHSQCVVSGQLELDMVKWRRFAATDTPTDGRARLIAR